MTLGPSLRLRFAQAGIRLLELAAPEHPHRPGERPLGVPYLFLKVDIPVEVVVAAGVGPVVADIPIKRRFVPCREQADISEPVRQDAAEIFGAGVVAVYDHRKDPAGDVAGIRPSRELQRVLGVLATGRCRIRVAAGLSRSSMQPATRMRVAPDERAGTEFPNAGR